MTALSAVKPAGVSGATAHAPVAFITGCGRSGTTILGRILAKHPDVSYLNDQHLMWAQAFPRFDVGGWVPFDPAVPAPLALSAADAEDDPESVRRFRAMLEERRGAKRLLVEKLTHNTMRMGFLRSIVPGCRIVYLLRNGLEVAHSIARRIEAGRWWGFRERKWECLAAHAVRRGLGGLLPLCTDPLSRGLLEWRLHVDEADGYFRAAGPEGVLALRYERMIADPTDLCSRLERFLGLSARPVVREFALSRLARRSPPAAELVRPAHAEAIAGEALRRLGYAP